MLEVVLLVLSGVCGTAGGVLLRQAQYLDGDGDAFWRRSGSSALAHSPRHALALQAQRRGAVLLALGAGAGVVVLALHALAR